MSFESLGLSAKVLSAVHDVGFGTPTPIQEQAIPPVLAGRDVIGIAQTGTGKTASFTLPMLVKLERGRARARMPRSLVIAPTRELASQVEESLIEVGKNHNLSIALLIGGVAFGEQFRKLERGADVLIATPGRLLDHFDRGKLLLTGVEMLVIDEADRMLDMGFIPDVERICGLLSPRTQILLFSATMAPEISKLAARFTKSPVTITVTPDQKSAATVSQFLVRAPGNAPAKRRVLQDVIRNAINLENAIIFCNQKRIASELSRTLRRNRFNADALHGDMDQRSRLETLARFRNGDVALLVASDVAARGLDIPKVSHVINFDVPVNAEDYVHRIGRTGRAGRSGTSVTLVSEDDGERLQRVVELVGDQPAWLDTVQSADSPKMTASDQPRATRFNRKSETSRNRQRRSPRGTAPAPVNEAPPPREGRRGSAVSKRADGRSRREEVPVVGLGDHTPAFLMVPGISASKDR